MRRTTGVLAGMLCLVAGSASAQTTRQMGALAVRDKAPSDKAVDLTAEDLAAVVKAMPGKNLATTRLLEGGFYSVNIRRLTGPETAHVHPTSLTIYVVREGSGTLVTGGTIVDAKGQPVPDSKPGDDIRGGAERTIKAGDIVVTPPGVPHFIRDVKGPLVFMNLIFERGAAANAGQPAGSGCDRECLRGKVTQLLSALVKHDVSGLPVADTLRVTEDAVAKPLAKVGLVGTVTRLRGFRQDVIDERAGVAAAQVVVEETGAPVLLVVRLKVVADKLTELELVATRSRGEGLIFNIDGLSAPSAGMNYAPRPSQLAARDEATRAALKYPEGLNGAKTFAAVNAPFAPGAYRYENGQVMAGPDCTFAPGCQNISTQSLAIFQRLGDVQTRVIAVDERMGIVLLRMAWGVRERGGDQLTVWEAFKVYDGQIHAVEAFMRILPFEKRNGGWQ